MAESYSWLVGSNRILSRLPTDELEVLAKHAAPATLTAGEVLIESGVTPGVVHFIHAGLVSAVASTADAQSLEVGLIGNEGVTCGFTLLGIAPAPFRLEVRLPGQSVRVDADAVRQLMNSCGTLHQLTLEYVQLLYLQQVQTALCSRFHTSQQRLARWLLWTSLLADRDSLPVTHEAMAQLVGGPRHVVTTTVRELRRRGLVDYARSTITILRRNELAAEACECYSHLKQAWLPSLALP